MDVLYTAEVTARGGREGEVVSDDGVLDLELAHPKELGGPADSDRTNPEQLFAAGYAACFLNALKRVAIEQKAAVTGAEMTARVGLGKAGKGFGLAIHADRVPPLAPARAGPAAHGGGAPGVPVQQRHPRQRRGHLTRPPHSPRRSPR